MFRYRVIFKPESIAPEIDLVVRRLAMNNEERVEAV